MNIIKVSKPEWWLWAITQHADEGKTLLTDPTTFRRSAHFKDPPILLLTIPTPPTTATTTTTTTTTSLVMN